MQYAHPKFPFSRLTSKSKIYYVKGVSLLNNKTRFVPASFVFIRYSSKKSDIGIYPTTGLACGKNTKNVRIEGICENVERDACMLTWLLRIPPKKIVNIKNTRILEILQNFIKEGIEIHLFELSIDLKLPVVLALGISNGNKYSKILIGSSCKLNKDDAIIKAIEELAQGFSWNNLTKKYKNFNFGKNFENIIYFEHHALLYSTLSNLSVLDFIIKTNRTIKYEDINSGIEYQDVLSTFKNENYDVIEIDLTTPDVISIGYYVKKIMIPGLQPLNSNHNLNFFDRKRINRVIKYLQDNKIEYSEKLNLFPHPFP